MRQIEFENLSTSFMGRRVYYFDSLGSTNDYVKENAGNMENGDTVITLNQFSGRGRMGHVWSVPPGESLAFSILIKDIEFDNAVQLLPHCAGMAVVYSLREFGVSEPVIKWPNDVLVGNRKVCGILCESVVGESMSAVIGIGVNLMQNSEFFRKAGLPNGASLRMMGVNADAFDLAARVTGNLEKLVMTVMGAGDFAPLLDEYCSMCINTGRTVKVIRDGVERTGTALTVNRDGSLAVDFGSDVQPVFSGEVSIRGEDGYY